jgi:hypothetical protein
MDLDVDLDEDLDDYLLHPQPQHSLRVVHAFMQDRDRAIEHVVEERVPLDENGVFRQERLIWCIKQQQQQQQQRELMHFKLRAMFLYNVDLEPEDLLEGHGLEGHDFIVPLYAVEDVAVKPTIPVFASLNGLYILYAGSSHNSSNSNNHNHNHNHSKKRVVIKDKKDKKDKNDKRDKHNRCHTRRST